MNLKSIAAAALLVSVAATASATEIVDLGPYQLSYDETTNFGSLAGSFSSADRLGFHWDVPLSAQVASVGDTVTVTVDLPSFTVTANPGWALSNPAAFLGNLVFTEVGGATTGILLHADVSINGGLPDVTSDGVDWVSTGGGTIGGITYLNGYFGEHYGPTLIGFNSLSFSNARIVLSASGGIFSSISAQPQNMFEFTLTAVPEPETYAMLLAGLGALGLLAQRRSRQG